MFLDEDIVVCEKTGKYERKLINRHLGLIMLLRIAGRKNLKLIKRQLVFVLLASRNGNFITQNISYFLSI